MKTVSYEEELAIKDEKEMMEDPMEKLNKARTKRLEKAFFAQMKFEEEMAEFEEWKRENLY